MRKIQDVAVYFIANKYDSQGGRRNSCKQYGSKYEYIVFACLIMRARVRTSIRVMLCTHYCIVFLNARDHAHHCVTAVLFATRWCLFLPNPQVESYRLAAACKCNFVCPLLFPH
jgi:hypothetical protein